MLYATLWQRIGAWLLDLFCYTPFVALCLFLGGMGRYFYAGLAALGMLVNAWYCVYLVKHFGGTPGKLLMGLRIVKTDGSPMGYREAFLRNAVVFSLSALAWLALIIGTLRMTDTEYDSLGGHHRVAAQISLAPDWYTWVAWLIRFWILSLFIVMLANNKRRATHDFMAGTVVIKRARREQAIQTGASSADLSMD